MLASPIKVHAKHKPAKRSISKRTKNKNSMWQLIWLLAWYVAVVVVVFVAMVSVCVCEFQCDYKCKKCSYFLEVNWLDGAGTGQDKMKWHKCQILLAFTWIIKSFMTTNSTEQQNIRGCFFFFFSNSFSRICRCGVANNATTNVIWLFLSF